MRQPVRTDLAGDRACSFSETITEVGVDLTGATMSAKVRLVPDGTGSAPISLTGGSGLTLNYGGSDTVANHRAASRLDRSIYGLINPETGLPYADADTVALSIIQIDISSATMSGVPEPAERGDDWVGAWDMLIDPDGAGPTGTQKWYFGSFTVRGTVTQ